MLLTTLAVVYLLVIVSVAAFSYRNDRVLEYRLALLQRIMQEAQHDTDHGYSPVWRYNAYARVPYALQLLKFWRALDSFYLLDPGQPEDYPALARLDRAIIDAAQADDLFSTDDRYPMSCSYSENLAPAPDTTLICFLEIIAAQVAQQLSTQYANTPRLVRRVIQ